MKKRFTFFALMLMMAFCLSVVAQETNRQSLLELSETFNARFEAQKAEALKLAEEMNLPVRIEDEEGRISELMYFKNGQPVYYITTNAGGAVMIKTNKVHPGGSAGLSLTGSGQVIGIWDGGRVLGTHQELAGRVTHKDNATTNSNHATHVAGTMMGAGVIANARGMAYAANIDSWDWNSDNAEMAAAAATGLKVSQHSYGFLRGWAEGSWSGVTGWHWWGDVSVSQTEDYLLGFYDENARNWDLIAYNAPYYLIVKSAGNDRGEGPAPGTSHRVFSGGSWITSTAIRDIDGGATGYNSVAQNTVSKNIISVGALNTDMSMATFSAWGSSWGPTDDGRIKPDIVAKGVSVYSSVAASNSAYATYNGTSMSGPMVSGSIGLLHHHQENLHPGENLRASTIKALIIHSADDMVSGAPGPDYRFGWGLMDTEKATQIMSENAANGLHIHELTLNNQQEITFNVKAKGGEPLRATIVWTDPAGIPVSPPTLNPTNLMLVNDLDMRLISSDNITYSPWILDPANPANAPSNGDNFRDNVEMIHIDSPVAEGIYELKITHKGSLSGGSQHFSLIISGNQDPFNVANPQTFTAQTTSSSIINLSWTKNTDNDNVMVVYSPTNSFGVPVAGTVYNPGQTLPNGGIVIYRGATTSFQHLNLNQATTYYYRAFSYNAQNEYSSGRNSLATTLCNAISILPFSENFSTTPPIPLCWEQEDHVGNGQVWQFGVISGYTPNPSLSGNYAFINSDAYGAGNTQNADLISPVFDLSAYSNVRLSFNHYYRHWTGSSAKLFYSIDNGASWVQITQWTSDSPNPATYNEVISAVAGQSQVRFKWKYEGTFAYYWAIDNILIDGCGIQYEIAQDFASLTFPPDCWSRTPTSGKMWQRAGASGYASGNGSAYANFHSHSAGSQYDLISPVFRSTVDTIQFDHAYATRNQNQNDRLIILYSTNNGSSYTQLVALNGGPNGPLNTGGSTQPAFTPNANQWATKKYALPPGTNRLMFRAISANGNNLYLDNIMVTGPIVIDLNFADFYQTSGLPEIKAGVSDVYGQDTKSFIHNGTTIDFVTALLNPGNPSSDENFSQIIKHAGGVRSLPIPVEITLNAEVENLGIQPAPYILNWSVSGVPQAPYSGAAVPVGATDIANLSYLPNARGTFLIQGSLAVNADEVPENNSNLFRSRVYPLQYGRTIYDNGANSPDDHVGWNSTDIALTTGLRFTATTATRLAGVDVVCRTENISSGIITIQIRATGPTNDAPGAVLYTAQFNHSVFFAQAGDYMHFPFNENEVPVFANGSDYWITISYPQGILFPAGIHYDNFTTGRSYYYNPTNETWNLLVLGENERAWIMRSVFVEEPTVWAGTEDSDWNKHINWSAGIPASGQDVIIPQTPNDPVLAIFAETGDLNIETGAKLSVSPSGQLTVSGNLLNSGDIHIKSSPTGTGSLLHNTNNVSGTIERYIPAAGYHLVSVPVAQSTNPLSLLFLWSYLFDFDKPSQQWIGLDHPTGTPLFVNRGYMIYKYPGPEDWQPDTTYSFSGPMHSGPFTMDVSWPNTGGNFSLVPNPYPSAIDWNVDSVWTKTNLNSSFWMWEPVSKNYGAWNGSAGTHGVTKDIPAGQAFFVQANAANPSLVVNNQARLHSNQPFFKQNTSLNNLLRIHANATGGRDEIIVLFHPEASNAFDGAYDAVKLTGGQSAPQLYSFSSDGRELSINCLPYSTEIIQIPLGFKMANAGEVSLNFASIDSFDPGLNIYFHDFLTETTLDLRKISEYTFTHNPQNEPARFKLFFNNITSIDETARPQISAWFGDGYLHLIIPQGNKDQHTVRLFNAAGQLVFSTTANDGKSTIAIPGLSRGIYMVQLIGDNGSFVRKVVY